MLIYIPVSYETIAASTGTPTMYNRALPVWATRPMEVEITMDEGYGVTLYLWRLTGSGAPKAEHTIAFPYSATPVTVDLSYTSVLFPTYDRSRSFKGDTYAIRIESQYNGAKIQIPVVNADMTFGQMQGVEEALPQPPKPRIPSIPADLFVLGRLNKVYPCVATPVTGYQGGDTMPVTITSGKTVDISNVKKLVISDYPEPGGTYEVNYEDRLWDDSVNDDSLWCALRIRWNMHNGQWYWDAFKSFFWNNKFTYLRGRGGVTEQAEITVNLEYSKEKYTVYQQLLASSNIFAMINIDGIMQHLQKEFRLDVVGDTGARWNGNDRVYRQQVKFRTTTLQDNYVTIGLPDLPAPAPAVITQSVETSNISKVSQAFMYMITSNVNARIESYPSWCTSFFPEDGKIGIGTTNVVFKASENAGGQRSGTIVIRRLGGDASVSHTVTQSGESVPESLALTPNNLRFPSSAEIKTVQLVASEPWAMSYNDPWCSIAPSSGDAGTFTLSVACIANTVTPPAQRIGIIEIRGLDSRGVATIIISQSGESVPESLALTPNNLRFPSSAEIKTVQLVASEPWAMSYNDPWCSIAPSSGDAGTFTLSVACIANTVTPPAQRIGIIEIRGLASGGVATIIISQSGKATPFVFTPDLPIILPEGRYGGTFELNAAHPWKLENYSPAVINILPKMGTANPAEIIRLLAAPNPASYPRMASFRITSQSSGDSLLKGFIQESPMGVPDAMVDPVDISADATRKAVIRIVSVGDWSASPSVSWLNVFPTSGAAGCHDIIVSLDVNNTGNLRGGYIRFAVNGTENAATVLVNQP